MKPQRLSPFLSLGGPNILVQFSFWADIEEFSEEIDEW